MKLVTYAWIQRDSKSAAVNKRLLQTIGIDDRTAYDFLLYFDFCFLAIKKRKLPYFASNSLFLLRMKPFSSFYLHE